MEWIILSDTWVISIYFIKTNILSHLAVRILWTFDNHTNDFYENYPGNGTNSPTYSSPGINGYGSCLYLNAANKQSITVNSPPFLNMAYTSFSLNGWIKPTTLHNSGATGFDSALFGQFDRNTTDYSFYITIRKQKPYFGFYFDDIQGTTVLSVGKWYHVIMFIQISLQTENFLVIRLHLFMIIQCWNSRFILMEF